MIRLEKGIWQKLSCRPGGKNHQDAKKAAYREKRHQFVHLPVKMRHGLYHKKLARSKRRWRKSRTQREKYRHIGRVKRLRRRKNLFLRHKNRAPDVCKKPPMVSGRWKTDMAIAYIQKYISYQWRCSGYAELPKGFRCDPYLWNTFPPGWGCW